MTNDQISSAAQFIGTYPVGAMIRTENITDLSVKAALSAVFTFAETAQCTDLLPYGRILSSDGSAMRGRGGGWVVKAPGDPNWTATLVEKNKVILQGQPVTVGTSRAVGAGAVKGTSPASVTAWQGKTEAVIAAVEFPAMTVSLAGLGARDRSDVTAAVDALEAALGKVQSAYQRIHDAVAAGRRNAVLGDATAAPVTDTLVAILGGDMSAEEEEAAMLAVLRARRAAKAPSGENQN